MIIDEDVEYMETRYRIVMARLRGRKARERNLWRIEFYAYSREEGSGVLEYRVKIDVNDLLQYLRGIGLGYDRRRRRIIVETGDWEKYAKTLLYTAIVSTIRKRFKKTIVPINLEILTFFDLKYWTGIITNTYRKQGYKATQRPIKALKTLLRL